MDITSGVVHQQGLVANPAPLGLCATAVANWAVGVILCGWAPPAANTGISIFYGGLAQFVAGLWAMRRREPLAALAFTTYGAWWISVACHSLFFVEDGAPFYRAYNGDKDVIMESVGWNLVLIFIPNCFFTICAIQTGPVSIAIFFWLGLSELLIFAGKFSGQAVGTGCIAAGGAVQIILAVTCFYSALAQTWNDMAGRDIIPLGKPVIDFSKEKKEG